MLRINIFFRIAIIHKAIILRFFILTTILGNLLIGLDDNLKTTHKDTSRD